MTKIIFKRFAVPMFIAFVNKKRKEIVQRNKLAKILSFSLYANITKQKVILLASLRSLPNFRFFLKNL